MSLCSAGKFACSQASGWVVGVALSVCWFVLKYLNNLYVFPVMNPKDLPTQLVNSSGHISAQQVKHQALIVAHWLWDFIFNIKH